MNLRAPLKKKYSQWSVIGTSIIRSSILCRCSCGVETLVRLCHLRSGASKRCAECGLRIFNQSRVAHGNARRGKVSPEWHAWKGMLDRCENKKNSVFSRYGGRGITVCVKWKKSFKAFLSDVGLKPSKEHTLERKDNNKGYTTSNVIWATRAQQSRNRSNSHNFLVDGKVQNLSDLAKKAGLKYLTVLGRLRSGYSIQQALSLPKRFNSSRGHRKVFPDLIS